MHNNAPAEWVNNVLEGNACDGTEDASSSDSAKYSWPKLSNLSLLQQKKKKDCYGTSKTGI